ncbi:PepSY-associated TM helix domain-containing protein [Pseudothauera rhizosphaerae]|uniref:PepSY-associated TM region n=1 Tax=Pseudothauera rhizosphaerae TaxID=2565932 RepID=A0A4S4ACV5_9RHOO|nr:PepSY-associated TM helix domain-containing protein [Pseudothauera rhizosphaerae]THF56870.1 hypothetical protein E6O51_18730 [Pseudothauera rhizosphaerae]
MPTYVPPPVELTPGTAAAVPVRSAQARRAWWLKTLHQWHWVSSAVCLFGMLLFAVTGITLNHSGAIEAKPEIVARTATLPEELAESLRSLAAQGGDGAEEALPADAAAWAAEAFGIAVAGRSAEWSAEEIYLPLPRPGGDAWLRFDLEAGEAEYELTDRGLVAWLNDLHKGRNSGPAWSLFIDVFAVACVLFSVTGLLILQVHAANRAAVWPTLALGVVIPALLVILFIH